MNQDKFMSFNKLTFPLIFIDEYGKIVFKNETAKNFKVLRINSNLKKFLLKSDHEKFDTCLYQKQNCIISIKENSCIYDALMYYDENTKCFAVGVLLCSFLYRSRNKKFGLCDEIELYRKNLEIVEAYKRMCEGANDSGEEELLNIVSKNTKQLLRAIHHMELYFCKYSDFKEKEEIICVSDTIRRIVMVANDNCSLFGYRINAASAVKEIVFMNTYKHAFYSVFVTLLTVALRLSNDRCVSVDMHEEHGRATIIVNATSAVSGDPCMFESEYSFIDDIASICGWEISRFITNPFEPETIRATFSFNSCDADDGYMLRAAATDSYEFEKYIAAEFSVLEK